MTFWIWLVIACCLAVYATVTLVRTIRAGRPVLAGFKDWLVNLIDIFSGGG
jgi:hypothetical protein